jgi:putative ABC transport system ATP-binding protein
MTRRENNMNNKKIISAVDLVKNYGTKENPLFALNHVNLEVYKGEFVSITGESGSGKTTLLNVLGTIDTADSGDVIFQEQSLTGKNDDYLSAYRRKEIGFIFQNYNLIPVLNVEENIMLPINLDSASVDTDYYEELLVMSGLESKRYSFPHELSGGQKQRVAIAGALATNPDILILDESTSMLDPKGRDEIRTLILKMKKNNPNLTVISITHDIEEAYLSDRVIVLSRGRVVLNNVPDLVFKNKELLASLNLTIPFILELKEKLQNAGIEVTGNDMEGVIASLCLLK